MAGPLSGIGGQQIPLSNTFQPGKDKDSGQVQGRDDRQQPPPAAEARQSDPASRPREGEKTSSDDILKKLLAAALEGKDSDSDEVRRGSVVDITV